MQIRRRLFESTLSAFKHARSFAAGLVVATSVAAPWSVVYPKATDTAGRSDLSLGKTTSSVGSLQQSARMERAGGETARRDEVVRMTDRDKRLLAFQKTCPACGDELPGKPTPGKVELTLFVCGPKCIQGFNRDPRETINKWMDTCEANAKARETP